MTGDHKWAREALGRWPGITEKENTDMNLGTIVVLLIVAGMVGLAVRSIVNDKKQGKSSCGCSIGGCSGGCTCCSARGSTRK